ncbi:MAG: hypothetical protein A3F46_09510 [Legionellales bacterium RIFCSPHIGHO2_12_FULL_42_9]|nr:MAG: hypothetical protein A3F46_09510 [Legionellales bacterium RIFCSPHIGHO2_12_FULL_42_9]
MLLGEDMGITWSKAALAYVESYLNQQNLAHNIQGMRLAVKERGCSGFSYVTEPVSNPDKDDLILPLTEAYSLYIDKNSSSFLQGVQVDCIKHGLATKLVFANPNQTGQCGCGESFTVK